MAASARVIGVHPVVADEPVHLIEIELEQDDGEFDFGELTQPASGQPRANWQVAYDEQQVGPNRWAFFFHYLDVVAPLSSSIGPLELPPLSPAPGYLRHIQYEPP